MESQISEMSLTVKVKVFLEAAAGVDGGGVGETAGVGIVEAVTGILEVAKVVVETVVTTVEAAAESVEVAVRSPVVAENTLMAEKIIMASSIFFISKSMLNYSTSRNCRKIPPSEHKGPYRLTVRTQASQAWNPGPIPGGVNS